MSALDQLRLRQQDKCAASHEDLSSNISRAKRPQESWLSSEELCENPKRGVIVLVNFINLLSLLLLIVV